MQLRIDRRHADAGPRLWWPPAELLLDALPPLQPDTRFLEVAAGTGALAAPLMERIAGLGRLVACDEDGEAARHLPSRTGRATRVVASVDRMPFVAGAFDVVLANLVLGEPAVDAARLTELHRVLRAKGWLLASVWMAGSFEELLDVALEASEAHELPGVRAALLEARGGFWREDALRRALAEAHLEVAHVGIEERALLFAGGEAAMRDPLVRDLLLPSWLDEPLPPAAVADAARAIDTYFGGRFSVRVRTAIVSARAETHA